VRRLALPRSVSRRNYLGNLPGAILTWRRSGGSNATVAKGDVFLWKSNQTWEDLWDVKRRMTHP
jgi:hypothetical protein